MSDSVRPQRWQPTRLSHPWDSPGKNTGVCCHFLLQCMKVKSEREVAQLCPTLSDPMDCSPQGSSIHGIFQARVLEWGAIWIYLKLEGPHIQSTNKNHVNYLPCHIKFVKSISINVRNKLNKSSNILRKSEIPGKLSIQLYF